MDDYKVIKINHIQTPNSNDNVPIICRNPYLHTKIKFMEHKNRKCQSNNSSYQFCTLLFIISIFQLCTLASFSLFPETKAGVLVNGSLHWLMKGFRYVVLCFDIVKQKHQEIQLPASDVHDYIVVQVLNECLCISRMDGNHNTELWIMKDYGVEESWTKLFTIKGKSLAKEISEFEGNWRHFKWEVLKYYREDGGILMLYKSKYLITYYPGNNTSTIEKISTKFGKVRIYGNCYIESLVSVNSGLYLTDAGPTKTILYIEGKKRGEVKSKINHLNRVW